MTLDTIKLALIALCLAVAVGMLVYGVLGGNARLEWRRLRRRITRPIKWLP